MSQNEYLSSKGLTFIYHKIESICRWWINPLPDNKILDWSKLKQIVDNILKCI